MNGGMICLGMICLVTGVCVLWAARATVEAEQELRSAICDRVRARGIIIPGVLEGMDGLPGPGERMPAGPGDTPCDPIAEAVA